jgi:hypothetical protein
VKVNKKESFLHFLFRVFFGDLGEDGNGIRRVITLTLAIACSVSFMMFVAMMLRQFAPWNALLPVGTFLLGILYFIFWIKEQ